MSKFCLFVVLRLTLRWIVRRPDRRGDVRFFWSKEEDILSTSVRLNWGLETGIRSMWPAIKKTRGKWAEKQKWQGTTSTAVPSFLVTELLLLHWNGAAPLCLFFSAGTNILSSLYNVSLPSSDSVSDYFCYSSWLLLPHRIIKHLCFMCFIFCSSYK